MERRTALQLVPLALLSRALPAASADVCGTAPDFSPAVYKPRFFSAQDLDLIDNLMALIIPADEHSPGAHEANTAQFADYMLATGPEEDRKLWREGLTSFRNKLQDSTLDRVLEEAAANETAPATTLDRFFVALKRMTVDGYYTSEIGIHKDLQYEGNTYLTSFPGCTHPEHQS